MIILTEDWLKLLIGLPLLGKGVTHEEFRSEGFSLSPRQKFDNQKYWNELLFPALPNPGLGKFGVYGERPRIVYRTDTIRSISCSLTSAEYNEIPSAANTRSQTAFSLVLAAFADTIIELSELPGIYVYTNVDRTSNSLRNFVGHATVVPPIRCDAANGMSLTEYASSLTSQLKQSLVHLPSEAAEIEMEYDLAVHKSGGILRHFSCTVAFTEARAKRSPFSSGVMAAPNTPRKIGPLTVTRLKIPLVDYNFNGLRLLIMPNADQTLFDFTYHDHFYSEKDMEALLLGMQDRLHTRFL